MIVTIAIAVGSALLHWLLQKQAVSRYEKCMKEAVEAARAARSADDRSLKTQAMVATHLDMLQPALAALPKRRAARTPRAKIV